MTRRALLLALAGLLAGATVASAATVTLASRFLATSSKTLTHATCTLQPASDDTYVNEASKTTKYASSSSLNVTALTNGRQRTLIQFSLGACGATIANASVDSATLTLNVTSASGGTRTLKVYRITAAWTGSATSWNNQPSVAGSATTTFSSSSSSIGSKQVDVTNDVNDFLQSSPTALPPYSGTVANNGWMIADEGSTTGATTMTSSNAGGAQVSKRPILRIDYAY